VLVPFLEKARVVLGISAVLPKISEPFVAGYSTDSVTFVKKAEAGVYHVLANEVGWVGCGEEVLGKAALGTSEGANFSGAPRLPSEPLAGVVTVPGFTTAPPEVAVPGVGSLTFL
jgi:hypothetical protein